MSSSLQKVSIIKACFNEENTIEKILEKVLKETLNFSYLNFEIIVINDASTDATQKILEKYANKKFKFLINERNFGKGYSLKRGIKEANGDIILFQDADLEYDPSDYKKLLKPILDGNADVVFGSRFIGSSEKRVLYYWHRIGNLLLTILSNMCSNLNLTDMEIGYKVFRSNIIKKISLQENRFGIEPEITAKIAKTKCRIYEVGVSYFGRTYHEGKKITWKDGISAIRCILYYNFFSGRVE